MLVVYWGKSGKVVTLEIKEIVFVKWFTADMALFLHLFHC